MKYQVNFGRLGKSMAEVKSKGTDRFRLAVLGDFSGRANKGELETGDALAKRKPLKVEFDTIDDVIGRLGIELDIPVGTGGSAHVEIGSIDDFHPDELYDNLEVFEEISGLRQRLSNTSMFESAAKEVQEWLGDETLLKPRKDKARSRGAVIPVDGKLSDFAKLVGRPTVEHGKESSSVEDLLKHAVAPFVEPSADPQQAVMVAAVDNALSGMMRSILHHPDFQELESLWRSVDLLTRSLETGVELQIVLFDISAEEVAADLSGAEDLTETGLYKLFVEQPALDAQQGPLSAIAACYTFEQTPPHAELLGRIAQIVAQSNTAFIAAIGADCLKKIDPDDIHPLVQESWEALRSMPEAAYLGLTVPRFMLRNPYGKKGEPIDPFEFEEFTMNNGLRSMLWGNSAVLAGLLLGLSFSKQGLKGMKINSVMSIGEMPFHYYVDQDGDQIALPCTDRLLTMKLAEHVTTQRFMPVLSIKGQPEVRLGSWVSLGGDDLSGAWAPAAAPSGATEPDAAPDDTPTAAEEDSLEEAVQAEEAVEDADDDGDDDLDDLLASLSDDDDEEDAGDDDADEEMDPELAALLADL